MQEYVVKQGECIESIAHQHGLFWSTVWNDAANAKLKEVRKNPNALLPGDRVRIRDLEDRNEAGGTEARHRFVRKGVPSKLVIILEDEQGKPRANVDYILLVDDKELSGTTDGQGRLEQPISPVTTEGLLRLVETDETFDLAIRHLDPVDQVTGIQARLRNMAYKPGPIDGIVGPKTRAATLKFQHDNKLAEDGIAGPKTQRKLKEVYGG